MAATPIAEKNRPFLEKIQRQASLPDIYDARDIAIVVFRTMRDMMPNESAERVASELQVEAMPGDDAALEGDIADLWKDDNPIVRFISRIRQPLTIDAESFVRRVGSEGGLPKGVDARAAIQAVFSATKDELSPERQREVSIYLPNIIRSMWERA
ncbi:MAG: DUF2267 domain-containing protein [Cyanobacteria bacterium P01_F01_bin.33]